MLATISSSSRQTQTGISGRIGAVVPVIGTTARPWRREDGLIPGAIALPRNSLEWRCDPASQWRHPALAGRDLRIILVCDQGYQSSLAAATLHQFGLIHATDLDGEFTAWAAAGLPVIAPLPAGQDPSGIEADRPGSPDG